ncbi:MAG: hypothetical protein ACREWE_08415 [Gammaproteobacteria bacterium]
MARFRYHPHPVIHRELFPLSGTQPVEADDGPYEKLRSLPKTERFLKLDVTFEHLHALAMQLSLFSGWAGTIVSGTTGAEQHRSKQLLDRRRRTS